MGMDEKCNDIRCLQSHSHIGNFTIICLYFLG